MSFCVFLFFFYPFFFPFFSLFEFGYFFSVYLASANMRWLGIRFRVVATFRPVEASGVRGEHRYKYSIRRFRGHVSFGSDDDESFLFFLRHFLRIIHLVNIPF